MSEGFQFDEAELAELRVMFFEQATETIDSLGGLILAVERDPSDGETLRVIRRAVHTLKGDSMAFGFTELTTLAHRFEDALDRVRQGDGIASRALIDLLLAGSDALAALIVYYRGSGPMPETEELVAGLAALHDTGVAETIAPAVEPTPTVEEIVEKESISAGTPEVTAAPEVGNIETAPEGASEDADPSRPESEEKRQGDERRSGEERRRGGETRSMTLRVESERIDAAMNLVGELIIQRSMISTLTAEIENNGECGDVSRRLSEVVALSGRILSELQESVMRMRLVPIDQVFRRFPRVVRDAGIKFDKPLRIDIEGGQTEIDKSIVELISDPLIHLIRNACDHGIEMPDVREAAGKAVEGTINLRARRAGNQIAVEVEDDGAGIDPEKIVSKGIEKGLVTKEEVADWSDQQKVGLIFAPGLSTKEQISDMSGRGVGMDVVKTSVDSLGGSITVSSTLGVGSRFTIKLPLTMAIVRAMLFESCERRFALPLDSIREITRLRGKPRTIDGREVLRLRDRVLPLIRIDEALGLREPQERDPNARLFVFVIELGDGRDVGIAVERLFGEQELVLKTVDDGLTQSAVVAGASILGDGNVVLILDAHAIVDQVARKNQAMERQMLSTR
jgi:two-component system chemotaxis sensor kinase CheA